MLPYSSIGGVVCFVDGGPGTGKSKTMCDGAHWLSVAGGGPVPSLVVIICPTRKVVTDTADKLKKLCTGSERWAVAAPKAMTYAMFAKALVALESKREKVSLQTSDPYFWRDFQRAYRGRVRFVLMVEEFSMMDQYTLRVRIDEKMRQWPRSCLSMPFGGKKVFLHGDPFQLPPPDGSPVLRGEYMLNLRDGGFLRRHALTRNYRIDSSPDGVPTNEGQRLMEFVGLLRGMKAGSDTHEVMYAIQRMSISAFDADGGLSCAFQDWLMSGREGTRPSVLAPGYNVSEYFLRLLHELEPEGELMSLEPPKYVRGGTRSQGVHESAHVCALAPVTLMTTVRGAVIPDDGEEGDKPQMEWFDNGMGATLISVEGAESTEPDPAKPGWTSYKIKKDSSFFIDVGGSTAKIPALHKDELTIRGGGTEDVDVSVMFRIQGQTTSGRVFVASHAPCTPVPLSLSNALVSASRACRASDVRFQRGTEIRRPGYEWQSIVSDAEFISSLAPAR